MTDESILIIITGFRGAGKTTLCSRLIAAAREAGWTIGGVISLPVFEGQTRVAIEVENLKTGEKQRLAVRREENSADSGEPHTRNWQFDSTVVAWSDHVLQSSVPTDLLVVDELGTLEFERGEGWQTGFKALDSGQYAVALVVIRPELLAHALIRWPNANIVEVDTPEESRRKADTLARQLF